MICSEQEYNQALNQMAQLMADVSEYEASMGTPELDSAMSDYYEKMADDIIDFLNEGGVMCIQDGKTVLLPSYKEHLAAFLQEYNLSTMATS